MSYFQSLLIRNNLSSHDGRPYYIIHNYQNLLDYKHNLEKLSKSLSFDLNAEEEQILPHYRYFDFKSKEVSFQIRIDGGIAH
ncbi:hypothetical protein [Litoribaculum gwangyangense]|uniref:Uncharacterized protein n=1 Tax=Litoribaculum gwangyangense TaxID=1130722 RepID=A0ABP9BYD6_9FLAO